MSKRTILHALVVLLLAAAILMLARLHAAGATEPADPQSIYELRCARCHQSDPAELVRASLVERDGRLMGRYSAVDVDRLLNDGHGRLDSEEATLVLTLLRRQLATEPR